VFRGRAQANEATGLLVRKYGTSHGGKNQNRGGEENDHQRKGGESPGGGGGGETRDRRSFGDLLSFRANFDPLEKKGTACAGRSFLLISIIGKSFMEGGVNGQKNPWGGRGHERAHSETGRKIKIRHRLKYLPRYRRGEKIPLAAAMRAFPLNEKGLKGLARERSTKRKVANRTKGGKSSI